MIEGQDEWDRRQELPEFRSAVSYGSVAPLAERTAIVTSVSHMNAE
jgi:hypothetical protein